MSTNFEFDYESIARFCNEFGVTIDYTLEQSQNLKAPGKTKLMVDQLEGLAKQICGDVACQKEFIEKRSASFHPVSMSLFVVNDALWKIMARKDDHPDKMLPMTTIPWFFWESDAESRKTPLGVRRLEDPDKPLKIDIDGDILTISGNGGDFCGLLEGRIADRQTRIRPLFIPGSTGPKKNVAKYESQYVSIKIDTSSTHMALYPVPEKEFDYIFSEHPRVFYDHGIVLSTEGENVKLKVGNRKETALLGKAMIFIGKPFKDSEMSDQILSFHVWLSILKQLPFL
jgi:hypothetical protein